MIFVLLGFAKLSSVAAGSRLIFIVQTWHLTLNKGSWVGESADVHFYICRLWLSLCCDSNWLFMASGVRSPLTFGSVQFVSCAFTPACRVDVGGVGIHPEVVAVRVAIKVEPKPVTAHLEDNAIHQRRAVGEYTVNFNPASSTWASIEPVMGHLTHLSHSQDKVHGWMLWVDAF